jgi:hypothetical protein
MSLAASLHRFIVAVHPNQRQQGGQNSNQNKLIFLLVTLALTTTLPHWVAVSGNKKAAQQAIKRQGHRLTPAFRK